jgi:hypothetical protein
MWPWFGTSNPTLLLGAPTPAAPLVWRPPPGPITLDRCELWTDVEGNAGRRLGMLTELLTCEESVRLDGEHTITFSVRIDHPLTFHFQLTPEDYNLRIDQVIRVMLTNGFSEHRIAEVARTNRDGQRIRSLIARSIFQDLGFRGFVTRSNPVGATTSNFEALGLTLTQHLNEFILPVGLAAGQVFWGIGELAHDHPLDMVYAKDTRLSACLKLATVAGDLEFKVSREADGGYNLNFVTQIGSGEPTLRVRAARSLVSLSYTERSDDQANRMYVFGAATDDGDQPTSGQATWLGQYAGTPSAGLKLVHLVDEVGGPGPIGFDGQFLPATSTDPEAPSDPKYYLKYLTGYSQFLAPIVATSFADQTVTVETPVFPPATVERVQIVHDFPGREVPFLDNPPMVAKYGVRVGYLEREDIPGTENLVPNPYGRVWAANSPLPQGWSLDNRLEPDPPKTIVTRETDSRFWQHGGQAMRVKFPGSGMSDYQLSAPMARIPLMAQGYLSFFVRVTTIVGRIQVWAHIHQGPFLPDGVTPAPGFPIIGTVNQTEYWLPLQSGILTGDVDENGVPVKLPEATNIQLNVSEDIGFANAWDLTKYPLYDGWVRLAISPADALPGETLGATPVECIVEAAQLTNSVGQMPLLEGSGGVRLHQAANARVKLYGPPAPVLQANLADLSMADGLPVTYDSLRLGAPIELPDPDTDEAIRIRTMGWTRDLLNDRLLPQVELSNQRTDITKILAGRLPASRHTTVLVPQGDRAHRYAPS